MRASAPHPEGGFTLVEVIVALALLFLGLSSAWVGVLAVERMGRKAEKKGLALGFAVSEMERVRAMRLADIGDTSYEISGLRVSRQARIPETTTEWLADSSSKHPKRTMVEVTVTSRQRQGGIEAVAEADTLASLTLMIPDYR